MLFQRENAVPATLEKVGAKDSMSGRHPDCALHKRLSSLAEAQRIDLMPLGVDLSCASKDARAP
jgi:hypothetical protein